MLSTATLRAGAVADDHGLVSLPPSSLDCSMVGGVRPRGWGVFAAAGGALVVLVDLVGCSAALIGLLSKELSESWVAHGLAANDRPRAVRSVANGLGEIDDNDDAGLLGAG